MAPGPVTRAEGDTRRSMPVRGISTYLPTYLTLLRSPLRAQLFSNSSLLLRPSRISIFHRDRLLQIYGFCYWVDLIYIFIYKIIHSQRAIVKMGVSRRSEGGDGLSSGCAPRTSMLHDVSWTWIHVSRRRWWTRARGNTV